MSAAVEDWLLRLNSIAFGDPFKAWGLMTALGPEGLASSGDADWAQAAGLSLQVAARWRRQSREFDLDGERRLCAAAGARVLLRGRPGYPDLLAAAGDAPLALYLQGSLTDSASVAVVGSRAPSAYGRRMARRFGADLARRAITVVSGLARGIDAEAHDAALASGGRTWAVLGSGLGDVYPPENRDLARRIVAAGGALLSEYPLSAQPQPGQFPRRNRIIAGLSWATVVVEGRASSGSRSTAEKAAEYGREVLAVPGPADSPLSETPLRLLRDGARLAVGVEDVVAVLPPGAVGDAPRALAAAARPDGADESAVLGFLGGECLSLDDLSRMTGLDTSRLSTIMFGLELKDLVCAVPGQRYAKKDV